MIEHFGKLQPDGMKSTSVEYQGCFGLIDCKKELRPYCL